MKHSIIHAFVSKLCEIFGLFSQCVSHILGDNYFFSLFAGVLCALFVGFCCSLCYVPDLSSIFIVKVQRCLFYVCDQHLCS